MGQGPGRGLAGGESCVRMVRPRNSAQAFIPCQPRPQGEQFRVIPLVPDVNPGFWLEVELYGPFPVLLR